MKKYSVAFMLVVLLLSASSKDDAFILKKWKCVYGSRNDIMLIKLDSLLKSDPTDQSLIDNKAKAISKYDKMKKTYMEFKPDGLCYVVCEGDTIDKAEWQLIPVPLGFKERYMLLDASDLVLLQPEFRNDSILQINHVLICKREKSIDSLPVRLKQDRLIVFDKNKFIVFESM